MQLTKDLLSLIRDLYEYKTLGSLYNSVILNVYNKHGVGNKLLRPTKYLTYTNSDSRNARQVRYLNASHTFNYI